MKNLILPIVFILSIFQGQAQDYCLYNAQKAFNFGDNFADEPFEIMQQPDGRFLVFGTTVIAGAWSNIQIVGMRLFPNGNLDPTFGLQGRLNTVFSLKNTAVCSALQDDGKILVGGYQSPDQTSSGLRPYVARFNSDGSADTDFGDVGSKLVSYGGSYPGEVTAIKLLSDGKIQAISTHFLVGFTTMRLLENGDPDSTYNETGYTNVSIDNYFVGYGNPSSLILEDGTSFLIANVPQGGNHLISVTKINPDGTMASDFGDNGTQTIAESLTSNNQEIRSELAFDDNIIISSVNSDNLPSVFKINSANGELITEFGDSGMLTAPISALGMRNYDFVKDVVNQEWVMLFSGGGSDVATMRIDDEGAIIPDCGSLLNVGPIGTLSANFYRCGIYDQDGILRISGKTSVYDSTSSNEDQNLNLSWPYYEPPAAEPTILSVVPNQMSNGNPVQVNVGGYGFNDVLNIALTSTGEVLNHSSFEIISDEELHVVFDPESIPLGYMDLEVYRTTDTLILGSAIEIIGEVVIDGDVNVSSRRRMLAGGETFYSVNYENKGTTSMLASPLVIINTDPYTVEFLNQPKYDLTDELNMLELIDYLNSQDIDPSILNESEFQDEGNQNHAFLTANLTPQITRNISGMSTISESGIAPQFVYLHPNPLVGSEGLIETYIPEPGFCTQEIVLSAILTAIPSAEVTNFESCFNLAYSQTQSELAAIVRNVNDERVIPFKGTMMKLLFDLMLCIDDTYSINEAEFELFNAEMAVLFATDIILDGDFPCEYYTDVSTYYHGLIEAPEDDSPTNAFNKSDGLGIGINFRGCYGCGTLNELEGVSSLDPNEKIGPSQQFGGTFINNGDMFYSIHFENVDSADIAAKTVYIVDTLDMEKLDVSTFKFTNVSWDDNVDFIDEDPSITVFDLRPEVPNILRVTTTLDEISGVATWKFETLDTLSLYPTEDIDQGFLPPNVTAPEGMGFVSFEVQLFEDIESGSTIENDAQIFFDFNDPITTNNWINTFDNEIPESHVNEITEYNAGESVANITWETDELDPNILFYNIYYNTDGSGDWIPWKSQTEDVESEFTGELGMTYYFMSVAVDSAFNVEEYAETWDAFIYMNPVGIEETEQINAFNLYPNPAQGKVVIQIEDMRFDNIILTDMTGRIVLEKSISVNRKQHLLDVGNLSKGVFYVSLLDDKNVIIGQKKLILY